MEIKESYRGKNFIFHLSDKDGKTTIGLASDYVYPSVDKNELKELVEFLNKSIVENKSHKIERMF